MASPDGTDFWAAIQTGQDDPGIDETGHDDPGQEDTAGSRTGEDPWPQPAAWSSGADDPSVQPLEPRSPEADPEWLEAERVAVTIRPRLAEIWVDLLAREVGGNRDLASKVYQVLTGMHMLADLWRDRRIEEIHVHGKRVVVSGTCGVREIRGFPSTAAARQAIATVEAKPEVLGAVVTHVGDSVVVSRAQHHGPDVAALIDSGVVTQDLVDEVRQALEEMRAVTVSGPAARVVIRAFAPLIPSGSRVFLGPLAVLPPGCIVGTSPLDADFVTGVRPGKVAEEMAAAGHVGALIANPETRFEASVELVVSRQSTAPGMIVTRRAASGDADSGPRSG